MWRGVAALYLGWVLYATTALLFAMIPHAPRLPLGPARALEPLRIANEYGLFANMTHERYEIEFQGSTDGQNWISYPFRYKPQDVRRAPGIYAPYQPRFEWNLWFASLGNWRNYPWAVQTEARLLSNEPDVLALFAGNPFANAPPKQVRAVIWQYWFTDRATKRATALLKELLPDLESAAWWRDTWIGDTAVAAAAAFDAACDRWRDLYRCAER